MLYHAKAPGSLMILGEYAVLAGKPAITCAINKFIHVTLQPRQDTQIHIQSQLGTYTTSLETINVQPPFDYVLAALALNQPLPSGCELVISGDCESGIGLGSSAAVTIAVIVVLNQWLKRTTITAADLWHQGMQVIQHVQGVGSGADLAASIYGGVIVFQSNPLRVEQISTTLPLTAIYSGNKLKTIQAIQRVNKQRQQQPLFFAAIDEAMGELSTAAITFIKKQDWPTLGLLWNQAQEAMVKLGVSNELLDALLTTLRHEPTIFGAKISGSGLGDCVIGLGTLQQVIFPVDPSQRQAGVRQIPLAVSPTGVERG